MKFFHSTLLQVSFPCLQHLGGSCALKFSKLNVHSLCLIFMSRFVQAEGAQRSSGPYIYQCTMKFMIERPRDTVGNFSVDTYCIPGCFYITSCHVCNNNRRPEQKTLTKLTRSYIYHYLYRYRRPFGNK